MANDYQQQLLALLPRGRVWQVLATGVFGRLLQAIGDELGRVEDRVADLLDEADPRTTSELLAELEAVAGLPESWAIPTTDDQRRALLTQHLTAALYQSESFFYWLAGTRLEYWDIDIQRHPYPTALDCQSVCNSSLYQDVWRYVWRITVMGVASAPDLEALFAAYDQAFNYREFNYYPEVYGDFDGHTSFAEAFSGSDW